MIDDNNKVPSEKNRSILEQTYCHIASINMMHVNKNSVQHSRLHKLVVDTIPIDLHTTETQNVQSTIHYLSKCFVQIKEKDMYIPNLLFRCIHRHDDMMF